MKQPDPSYIAELLHLSRSLPVRLEQIAGDASSRSYYRAFLDGHNTFVIMLMDDPTRDEGERFIKVHEFLLDQSLPVPLIHGFNLTAGLIALQDLGSMHLADVVTSSDSDTVVDLYSQAVSVLARLRLGSRTHRSKCRSFNPPFDVAKFMEELNFFLTYYVGQLCGLTVSPKVMSIFQDFFETIVSDIDWDRQILCHRDYHSRNLMWVDGNLFMIDFQDARLGPEQYDLASLLRDSYVSLTDDVVESLLGHYYREACADHGYSFDRFRYLFDVVSLQRNIKALGTFGYQTRVRGSLRYLESIPRTCRYIESNIRKHSRFGGFSSVADDFIVGPGLLLESSAEIATV